MNRIKVKNWKKWNVEKKTRQNENYMAIFVQQPLIILWRNTEQAASIQFKKKETEAKRERESKMHPTYIYTSTCVLNEMYWVEAGFGITVCMCFTVRCALRTDDRCPIQCFMWCNFFFVHSPSLASLSPRSSVNLAWFMQFILCDILFQLSSAWFFFLKSLLFSSFICEDANFYNFKLFFFFNTWAHSMSFYHEILMQHLVALYFHFWFHWHVQPLNKTPFKSNGTIIMCQPISKRFHFILIRRKTMPKMRKE